MSDNLVHLVDYRRPTHPSQAVPGQPTMWTSTRLPVRAVTPPSRGQRRVARMRKYATGEEV